MNKILRKLDKQAYKTTMLQNLKGYLNEQIHNQGLTFDKMQAIVSRYDDFQCVELKRAEPHRYRNTTLAFITYDLNKKKLSIMRTPIPDETANKILAELSK